MKRRLLSIVLVAAIPGGVSGQDPLHAEVDRIAVATLERYNIPGLAIALVSNDSLLLVKGYGRVSVVSSDAVTASSRFEIGSVTKAVTATAVAVLVDDAAIDWDDRVVSILQDFSIADDLVTERLTVRDILSMRSGFSTGDAAYGSAQDPEEVLRMVSTFEAPGFRTRGGYTPNLNYFLAGRIVEAAAGETWEAFVQERIFEPAGMGSTGLRSDEAAANRVTGHRMTDDGPRIVSSTRSGVYASAGGLESTAGDLARWMQYLLRHHAGADRSQSSDGLRETWVPQAVAPARWLTRFNPEGKFMVQGMPWLISQYRGVSLIEAPGGTSGFTAIVTLIPEERLGLTILLNAGAAFAPLRDLKLQIVRVLVDGTTGSQSE